MRGVVRQCSPLPFVFPAILLAACGSGAEAFRFQVTVPSDLLAATHQIEARFFAGRSCGSFALRGGAPDLARTATATIRLSARGGDGFVPVDLSSYSVNLALDVRAVAADGTPMARRCAEIDPGASELGFVLARFLPEHAVAELAETTALVAGTARSDAVVRVRDDAGEPIENAWVSTGPTRSLIATDALGLAHVGTPTDTPSYFGPLPVMVYGLPGAALLAHAAQLEPPTCPELEWSRDLVTGLSGANVALASAGSEVALLRPRSATTTAMLVEVFAVDPLGAGLLTLDTATVSGRGALAVSMDGLDLEVAVASSPHRVELLRVAGETGQAKGHGSIDLPEHPTTRIHTLLLSRPLGLLIGGAGIPGGVLRASREGTRFLAPQPLADNEVRAVVDLYTHTTGEDPPSVLAATPSSLEHFAMTPQGFVHQGPSLPVNDARWVPQVAGTTLLAFTTAEGAGGGTLFSFDLPEGQGLQLLAQANITLPPSGSAVGDLNRDQRDDVIFTSRRANELAILVGDGRGHFLEAKRCPLSGGPSNLAPLYAGSSASLRWVTVLESAGKIGVLELPR